MLTQRAFRCQLLRKVHLSDNGFRQTKIISGFEITGFYTSKLPEQRTTALVRSTLAGLALKRDVGVGIKMRWRCQCARVLVLHSTVPGRRLSCSI